VPDVAAKTNAIRAKWADEIGRTKVKIKERMRRAKNPKDPYSENDPELVGLRLNQERYELELEGWSIALARQDPAQNTDYLQPYLDSHLCDVKDKIKAAPSLDGSLRSDTTSTILSR